MVADAPWPRTARHLGRAGRRAPCLLAAVLILTSGCRQDATAIVLTLDLEAGTEIDQVDLSVTRDGTEVVSGRVPDAPASEPIPDGGTIAILLPDDFSGPVEVFGAGFLTDAPIATGRVAVDVVSNELTAATLPLTNPLLLPLSVAVSGDDLLNPPDVINAASAAITALDVDVGTGALTGDRVEVTITDGNATSVSAGTDVAAPGGAVVVQPVDASALADGPLVLEARLVREGLTAGDVTGSASKDTVAPPLDVDPVISPTSTPTQTVSGLTEAGAGVTVSGGAGDVMGVATTSGAFVVDIALATDAITSLSVVATDSALNATTPVDLDRVGTPLEIVHGSAVPEIAFTDASAGSGIEGAGAGQGTALADVDGDGDLDLFITGPADLFLNDGDGTFTSSGLSFGGGRSAVFGDFDNDGDPDLATTSPALFLFENTTPTGGPVAFVDVTGTYLAALPGNSEGAAWLDYDADGLLDLFVENGGATNRLYRNGVITPWPDEAMPAGVDNSLSNGNWVVVADFDVDADVDLVVADVAPSQFFRNLGTGMFEDATALLGVPFDDNNSKKTGVTFADFDDDGDFDLLVLRGAIGSTTNLLFSFDGSSFTDVAAQAGLQADILAKDGAWGDIDLDGRLDLFVAANGANALFLNRGDTNGDGVPEFEDVAPALGLDDTGNGRSALLFDLEGDGDLDIYVVNAAAANLLYVNDLVSPRHLSVLVIGGAGAGGTANRDAIGAVVQLLDETDAVVMTREVNGGRGVGGQDPRVVHFGGVIPSLLYRVRVTFPGGTVVEEAIRPFESPSFVLSE